jgi:nucleoside-diphosphate-sugar epimerase
MCDIMNPAQIEQAMVGVDWVAHCAYTDEREVIIQGTKNMLDAALRTGVKRFVFVSTAEVYGSTVSGNINESVSPQVSGWEYPDAKIEAEKLCWEYYQKGVPVTILRPSIVYGPFSLTWVVGYALRLLSGNWGLFKEYGDGICNLIYVDDLVNAILLGAYRDAAIGEVFNVNGPDRVTWNQFFQKFNDLLGGPPLHEIDSTKLKLKATTIGFARQSAMYLKNQFGPAVGKTSRLFLSMEQRNRIKRRMKSAQYSMKTTANTRDLDRLYSRKAFFEMAKAQEKLDYQPQFDMGAGLQISVDWLEHHGWIPARSKS